MLWALDLRPLEALMSRLGYEPRSLWRAVDELQDHRWFGYTPEAERLDNVTDWQANTWHATAQSASGKKRVKRPEHVERPQDNSKQTQKPMSLDDVGSFFASS